MGERATKGKIQLDVISERINWVHTFPSTPWENASNDTATNTTKYRNGKTRLPDRSLKRT
jgi:hypothetical protein